MNRHYVETKWVPLHDLLGDCICLGNLIVFVISFGSCAQNANVIFAGEGFVQILFFDFVAFRDKFILQMLNLG